MIKKYFWNIGGKIKNFAIFIFFGLLLAGIGYLIFAGIESIKALIISLSLIASGFILPLFIYGFGELVENTTRILNELKKKE